MNHEVLTLGGGCFWCVEAFLKPLRGVVSVESGYAGGAGPRPTYEEVCSGRTGHAEVVQVTYDPEVLSTADLLQVFFTLHDPTTLNRQGADSGTQYRSVIFYRNAAQKAAAEAAIREIEAAKVWEAPVVTQLEPFHDFYPAESYHQDYYARNQAQPYCQVVIAPKVAKLRAKFQERLR